MELTHLSDEQLNAYIHERRQALKNGVRGVITQARQEFGLLNLVRRHPVAACLAGATIAAVAAAVVSRAVRRRVSSSSQAATPTSGTKEGIMRSVIREMIRSALVAAGSRVGTALAERAVDEMAKPGALRAHGWRHRHTHNVENNIGV